MGRRSLRSDRYWCRASHPGCGTSGEEMDAHTVSTAQANHLIRGTRRMDTFPLDGAGPVVRGSKLAWADLPAYAKARHAARLPCSPGWEPTQHTFQTRPGVRRRPVHQGVEHVPAEEILAPGARGRKDPSAPRDAWSTTARRHGTRREVERLGAQSQNPITNRCCGWRGDIPTGRRRV